MKKNLNESKIDKNSCEKFSRTKTNVSNTNWLVSTFIQEPQKRVIIGLSLTLIDSSLMKIVRNGHWLKIKSGWSSTMEMSLHTTSMKWKMNALVVRKVLKMIFGEDSLKIQDMVSQHMYLFMKRERRSQLNFWLIHLQSARIPHLLEKYRLM